jgi:type I restriction enzyme S subunit
LKALFLANYSEIASGTTFEELKIFALRELEILIPPTELQNKYQTEIEKINNEIEGTNQSLKKSEGLFSSLVQGAFG